MPTFAFQAKAMGGRLVKGEIIANNDVEARVKLRAQQLIPIKVALKAERGMRPKASFNFGGAKVNHKDLQIFTRQFATLINSGIPVVQSLEILAGATNSASLSRSLIKVRADVESGKRLADDMEMHKNAFDRLYVNLVKAGEEGGVLDTILNRLALYIEKSVKIRNKIQGALWYPAAISVVAVMVIAVILVFVIPKFESLFTASGKELPWLTQQVVGLSHFVVSYWYVLLAVIFGTIGFLVNYVKTDQGRKQFDAILIATPVFGSLVQKGSIAKFSRTLSTMLTCGVGIIESLDIAARVSGNSLIEASLLAAKQAISEGKTIISPLSQNKFIPRMVVQMIGVGEQTGALDTMLGKIADFYEDEVDYAVTALTSILEPLMMVVLGGIIAVLVVSMYLPIFSLASNMGG